MKMNKVGTAEIAAFVILGLAFAYLPFATPKFREKKAVEICSAGYHTVEYCEKKVAKMSKEEILDSIRDIGVNGNAGNFK